jgi:predicted RNase H-like HicB family nuclease
MSDVDHYSMILEWDPEDEIFVVTVPELPGCRTHGSTREEALKQGRDAIESWIEAARAWNVSVPRPREFAQQT